jgi:hypothetical protein
MNLYSLNNCNDKCREIERSLIILAGKKYIYDSIINKSKTIIISYSEEWNMETPTIDCVNKLHLLQRCLTHSVDAFDIITGINVIVECPSHSPTTFRICGVIRGQSNDKVALYLKQYDNNMSFKKR